ncbi:MAG: ParB N-terminal domain-containing protein [Chloroflexi bacterium]|nr:ParB N-terminal domain-containing protein [Chloroflexota bacterium]
MEEQIENIADALLPITVDIDSVRVDPTNARVHPASDVRRLARSLIEFGQRKPIVVNSATGLIEAGHGIWLAAKHNGWKRIAAVMVNDDPSKARSFGIADNRLHEFSSWDDNQLGKTLADLRAENVDLAALGFLSREVDKAIERLNQDSAPDEPVFPICPSFDEHYEIIVIICRTLQDWMMAQTVLRLRKEQNPPGKTQGVKLSHVVEFERFAKLWKSR